MNITRREFLQMLAVASASGISLASCGESDQAGKAGVKAVKKPTTPYEFAPFGNVSFMHYTDCHAQLMPIWFREPSINLGVAGMKGRPPHLVGRNLLDYYGVKPGSPEAYAFTCLDFTEAARKFGKVGGFAHLATLVKKIREQRPGAVLLDGGDTWQGSGTAYWTNAQDMVDAQKLLGVDVMTPHWEMTYGADRVMEIIDKDFKGQIDFVAQNVVDNEWGEQVFKPYVIREI
ncbi:MAG TPA: thiosulfohydrolase SoxB, partial [Gammaproteobacteria bacterium]|nr:thiosulfohydrolase SoxB [Gammaproteobacteria bacterium]